MPSYDGHAQRGGGGQIRSHRLRTRHGRVRARGAVEALREVAPRVPLIALHERPAEIMRTPASVRAQFAAVLPRSLAIEDFMYAVACALREPTTRRREPAA